MNQSIRIAVVGGGISGLACAHRLLELKGAEDLKLEVLLFEESGRLGGAIETEKRDGFVLEKGPDSFLSEKPQGIALSQRIGLEPQIIGTREDNRRSFIVKKGKLVPLPKGFYIIAPMRIRAFLKSSLLSFSGRVRMLLEVTLPKRASCEDESVGDFIRRRFGQEALDRIGQAMLAGIYAGDPDSLSLKATMPRFLELEQTFGSVIRGLVQGYNERSERLIDLSGPRYGLFVSYKEGMETLPRAMKEILPWSSIHLNSPVTDVKLDSGTGKWKLLVKEEDYVVDAVCFTQAAPKTSQLLKNIAPTLAAQLSDIRFESVATINLAYKREEVSHALDGFGFVAPRIEKRPVFATSFSSRKFEGRSPEGYELFRSFVGGAFGRETYERSDSELEKIAHEELVSILGVRGKPLFCALKRHPDSMVQYAVGHLDRLPLIADELKKLNGIYVTGTSYKGFGIPDCIREAEGVAEELFSDVLDRMRQGYETIFLSKLWKNK